MIFLSDYSFLLYSHSQIYQPLYLKSSCVVPGPSFSAESCVLDDRCSSLKEVTA